MTGFIGPVKLEGRGLPLSGEAGSFKKGCCIPAPPAYFLFSSSPLHAPPAYPPSPSTHRTSALAVVHPNRTALQIARPA